MGSRQFCPFPTCHVEYYTYCRMHRDLMPAIQRVVDQMDPEAILSFSVNVSNLSPMVKMMEEQWKANDRLQRELRHYETEMARLEGGR